jgi:hypothetical protein
VQKNYLKTTILYTSIYIKLLQITQGKRMELDDVIDSIINFTVDIEFFIKILVIIILLCVSLYPIITLFYSESDQLNNLQTLINTIQGAISSMNIIYILIISIGITYLHNKTK